MTSKRDWKLNSADYKHIARARVRLVNASRLLLGLTILAFHTCAATVRRRRETRTLGRRERKRVERGKQRGRDRLW